MPPIGYVRVADGAIIALVAAIKAAHPEISWPAVPAVPDEAVLASLGYARLYDGERPEPLLHQKVVHSAPVEQDGVWVLPYTLADKDAADFEADRQERVVSVNQHRDGMLAAGFPYGGKTFDVSDGSLIRFAGMSLAATLSAMASAPWDPEYADGWIALDNTRLPLPTHEDGLLLGQAVGSWTAKVIQNARTLKDAILAVAFDPEEPAASFTALAAIDTTVNWPE